MLSSREAATLAARVAYHADLYGKPSPTSQPGGGFLLRFASSSKYPFLKAAKTPNLQKN
jgi:hypothetical protein